MKLTFSSPVATAEFSKFSGISVNGCKKKKKEREREINASLPKAGPSWRCFARPMALFNLLPHYLSLPSQPFDFSFSLLLPLGLLLSV